MALESMSDYFQYAKDTEQKLKMKHIFLSN